MFWVGLLIILTVVIVASNWMIYLHSDSDLWPSISACLGLVILVVDFMIVRQGHLPDRMVYGGLIIGSGIAAFGTLGFLVLSLGIHYAEVYRQAKRRQPGQTDEEEWFSREHAT